MERHLLKIHMRFEKNSHILTKVGLNKTEIHQNIEQMQ